MYGIDDPFGVKIIIRLRLGFSDLREHKFRLNFADTALLKLKIQSISFYAAKNNLSAPTILMNELNNISNAINSLNSIDLTKSNPLWR